jgi:hypothetical protein
VGFLKGCFWRRSSSFPTRHKSSAQPRHPRDPKTGKALQLHKWGLKDYIDVAHELGWITKTTKDIAEVVRDYRNYIHPEKELSHGITLEPFIPAIHMRAVFALFGTQPATEYQAFTGV